MYQVIDTETNGLPNGLDFSLVRPVRIGVLTLVDITDSGIDRDFTELTVALPSDLSMSTEASRINRITDEASRSGIPVSGVRDWMRKQLCLDSAIVGHNIMYFDNPVLDTVQVSLSNHLILDTKLVFRAWMLKMSRIRGESIASFYGRVYAAPSSVSLSLNDLCILFEIEDESRAHTTYGDTVRTWRVLQNLHKRDILQIVLGEDWL